MRRLIFLILLAFCISTMTFSCKEKKETETTRTEENKAADKADIAMNEVFQCPMDCEEGKTYDKEGKCPICEMDLKKAEGDEEHKDNEHSEEKGENHSGHDHN